MKMSKIFQKLEKGYKVTIDIDKSYPANFPKRMQGKTGTIEGKRGKSFIVKIKDFNKVKTYIIKPIHLKKIK